jgi:hypothetical protein
MKKIILITLLLSTSAFAEHNEYRHEHHGYWQRGNSGWVWVAPTIIGGIIGYEIAKSQPPVVVQQPVIVQPVQPTQVCSPWTEIQNSDGTITRTRTCTQ